MSPVALPVSCLDAAVVLCGGASRRMGTDKAACEVGGKTLLEHAVAVAREAASTVFLATGSTERYAELGLDVVLDRVEDGGPMAGIEAALARLANERGDGWLGILAVDMPRAAGEILVRCAARGIEHEVDAVLVRSEAGIEPLLGAVHTRALPALRGALDRGERRAIAYLDAAPHAFLPVGELPADLAARGPADNLNTPADLDRMVRRFEEESE